MPRPSTHAQFSLFPVSMSILRRLNLPRHLHRPTRRHRICRHRNAGNCRLDHRPALRGRTRRRVPLPCHRRPVRLAGTIRVTHTRRPVPPSSGSRPCQASFLAIASPPKLALARGAFEFLVKSVAGSTAEALCRLKRGDVVELSRVMGNGFDIGRFDPPEKFQTVLIFATGSGISPIRSLIESGFDANKRFDVRLYYGARNLQRMAYLDRFKDWESSGVKIVPVLSQPDDGWTGEWGYVQDAFSRLKQISNPLSTGVVLCGRKQMTEEITSILVAEGVSGEKILKNF